MGANELNAIVQIAERKYKQAMLTIEVNNDLINLRAKAQQVKDAYIQKRADEIEAWVLKSADHTTTETTCSRAPAFGWSVQEYTMMPTIANELRSRGIGSSSAVNFEVTDWKFWLM